MVRDDQVLQDRVGHRCCSPGSRTPTHANSHAYSNANGDSYGHTCADSNANGDRYCYRHRDYNANSYSYGHSQANADCQTKRNTEDTA